MAEGGRSELQRKNKNMEEICVYNSESDDNDRGKCGKPGKRSPLQRDIWDFDRADSDTRFFLRDLLRDLRIAQLNEFALDTLPFGGTGESGFGKYHGRFSFDQFSHRKAVMRRSFCLEFSFRYPPWNDRKLQFIRYLYSFNYVGLLLLFLGLKRCSST